jgi:nitrile hydratase
MELLDSTLSIWQAQISDPGGHEPNLDRPEPEADNSVVAMFEPPTPIKRFSISSWTSMTDHDHHHHHDDHSELSETELRVRALETILAEKGYLDSAALDAIIQAYETRIGPHIGARVVAKAWSDSAFKKALLEDASKAVRTLGHTGRVGDHLVAVENTPQRHNMVVCTLCSCYPWDMLGLPPVWYKAAPYRSRAVKDPRGVLADFDVNLPKDTEIRVWDSTAETRFLVLPMRPKGTDGWSEEQLAELVTRDSMIGTGFPKTPESRS